MRRRLRRLAALGMKRLFDLVFAVSALVVLSPVIVAASVAIRVTMGAPVIFRQERIGRKGRPFRILKFRTMTAGAGPEGRPLPDEERITRVGAFLRRSTLDELPELVNVLRGEMSIVGPRPLLSEYRGAYTAEQFRRHDVRPGMAGPVLAAGRNSIAWDDKFALDLWYVDNWSLRLDARILARTAKSVCRREGVSAEGHATMPSLLDVRGVTDDEGDEPWQPS